jgi:ornithine decarboxylase
MLYQNDGIYGNFMNNLTEKEYRTAKLIHGSDEQQRGIGRHEYSIWGPTGDSLDVVKTSCWSEEEAMVGDWIFYENMGGWCFSTPLVDSLLTEIAYSLATVTTFNGFTNNHDVIPASKNHSSTNMQGT